MSLQDLLCDLPSHRPLPSPLPIQITESHLFSISLLGNRPRGPQPQTLVTGGERSREAGAGHRGSRPRPKKRLPRGWILSFLAAFTERQTSKTRVVRSSCWLKGVTVLGTEIWEGVGIKRTPLARRVSFQQTHEHLSNNTWSMQLFW